MLLTNSSFGGMVLIGFREAGPGRENESVHIEILSRYVLWTNPTPVLRSRHSFFPWACELPDGTLLASHVIGEAFESVDGATRLSVSRDRGEHWELLPPFYDKSGYAVPTTDILKPTVTNNGELVLFGYEFFRPDPDLPLGNPETGGLLDAQMIIMSSFDQGKSWSPAREVPCRWGRHAEASSPLLVLPDGQWVTPITEFAGWDGHHSQPLCGRLLRTRDRGKTWDDDTIIMSLGDDVSVFEQRICRLEGSGHLVVISWNEDLKTGELYNNHYAVSEDQDHSFSGPYDTGVRGQASSVCALDGEQLLALHAVRRDTGRPGIYGYVVNLAGGRWDIEAEALLWEPALPPVRDDTMAEAFAYLKFGQPGALRLSDGTLLMTHWAVEAGQGRTLATRLRIG